MKSIRYSMLGLFILSLIFVAGNSFSQPRGPMLTPYEIERLRTFGFPGAGGGIRLYSQPSASDGDTFAASTMIWSQLRTSEGDYLAEISDLVIDPENGRVSAVILTRIREMGAKEVVVPFSSLSKTGRTIFVYNDPENVYRFYGEAPYRSEGFYLYSKQQEPMGSYKTSKLIGTMVRTPGGENLGRIDDLVINSKDGDILHLVVSPPAETEGKLACVPFSTLSKGGENVFVMKTTKEELKACPI